MSSVTVFAAPSVFDVGVENHKNHGCGLGDSSFKAQVDRWASRPLETENPDLVKFGSFKGRGYVLMNLGQTLVREPYRLFKSFLVLAEKVFNFVRTFFQNLFREDGASWEDLGQRGKDILSVVGSILVRPLTFVLDMLKLGGGLFLPKAAIHFVGQVPEGDDGASDATILENA